MENTELIVKQKQEQELEIAFRPKIAEREALTVTYETLITKEITKEVCKEAAELGKKLVKVRTGIAAIHKTQKDFSLAYGRLCDSWKNKETLPVIQMEEKLSSLKTYFEDREREAKKELQESRVAELLPYNEEAKHMDLASIDADVWPSYLETKKKTYEEEQEALRVHEEELKAKAKEEAEEKERLRKENDKLKAAEKERLVKEERLNKAGAARQKMLFEINVTLDFESCKAMDEKVWTELYEEKHKAYQSEQNRLHIEKLKAEKNRSEEKLRLKKLESELKVKAEAEAKAKAAIEKELNASDKDKFNSFLKDLTDLKTKYVFKSEKNNKIFKGVYALIDKVINYIKEKA